MRLRSYQKSALSRIKQELDTVQTTLCVMATGTGKTVLFSHLAQQWDGRVLIMAHREELIEQAAEKVEHITGLRPGIEMAEARVNERDWFGQPRVVVSSVQTLSRPSRIAKFKPDAFGLVIVDEAHHAPARTYRQVLEHFDVAKVLGVTATPKRGDGLAMGQIFQSVAFDYGIEPAIDDGWLVPIHQKVVKVDDLDFSSLRKALGDFQEGELESLMIEERHLHSMAAPVVELAGEDQGLMFCCGVEHARLMSQMLNRYKEGSSAWLSGETDKLERRMTVAQYKAGNIQFLCNCGLFLEGFDAPNTKLIVMGRPTQSLSLYIQVLGRGTRTQPGCVDSLETPEERRAAIAASQKPWMTVLDFAGNAGKHQIIQASDVLGGKYGDPVIREAKRTMEAEGGAPIAEALDRAAVEVLLLEEEERRQNQLAEALREEERRRELVARAEYRTAEVSPFGGASPAYETATRSRGTATEKQVWKLTQLGVSRAKAESMSKVQASVVIGKILKKQAMPA